MRVLVLVGPTASGKTALSLTLARRLGGEILSADSRQLYRRMDIGTAKPLPEELAVAPHHGIDLCEPDAFFSAGAYAQYGRKVVHEIAVRGKVPIVVGGSGLYVQALVDGVFEGGYRDELLREHLRAECRRLGAAKMVEWLARTDPQAAARIHLNDEKRLLRALEVQLLSGKPISQLQEEETEPSGFDARFFGLNWPRPALYDRINGRVDQMMAAGLLDEVKGLRDAGYDLRHNALDSVGYKELLAALDGQSTLDEAVELIKRNTRRFAKRQMTWFKRDARILWLGCDEETPLSALADVIVAQFEKPSLS